MRGGGRRFAAVGALALALVAPSVLPTGLPLGATSAVAAAHKATLSSSASNVVKGEAVWFTGTLRDSSGGAKTKVILQHRAPGGSWRSLASTRSSASGSFTIRTHPTSTREYRIRAELDGKMRSSETVRVTRTTKKRSLETRRTQIGDRLGTASTGVKTARATSLRKVGLSGVTKMRYQTFSKGTLVEVTRKGAVRTWLVQGKIRTAWNKAKKMTGTYGVPKEDAQCGLLEGGCVQSFAKGALYSKSSKSKAIGQKGTSRAAELIAVARSQVGYKEPSWRGSKYNRWVGSSYAWCGVFQSWVAVASGNPGVLPTRDNFPALVRAVKASKSITTFSPRSKKHKPKVGSYAFYDYSYSRSGATHVGLILQVRKKTLVTLEGNTSKSGGFGSKRGVYIRERSKARVDFYAHPSY